MLWWSASSPRAPVGGSTEAQWGKRRNVCVRNCARLCMRVFIVLRRMQGDLRFLKMSKVILVCALLCVGTDERERKWRQQRQL